MSFLTVERRHILTTSLVTTYQPLVDCVINKLKQYQYGTLLSGCQLADEKFVLPQV